VMLAIGISYRLLNKPDPGAATTRNRLRSGENRPERGASLRRAEWRRSGGAGTLTALWRAIRRG
jgi:hypothetical protein